MMNVFRCPVSELPEETSRLLDTASLMTSGRFARVWGSIGGRAVVWCAEVDGELQALCPGVEFGRWPLTRFQAMPDGCYAGLIDINQPTGESAAIGPSLMAALAGHGYARVFLNDFHRKFRPQPKFEALPQSTILVDITDPEWEPPDKKLRQQIRKAEREGLKLQTFDAERHFDSFRKLIALSERPHGVTAGQPVKFYEALAALAKEDDRLVWTWCEHDGQAVASSIFLIDGRNLLHWQVFFDAAFSHLQTNKFVPYTMAKQIASRGITHLNLGATPVDAAGVLEFKQKWGGRTVDYTCYRYQSVWGHLF